MGTLKKIQKEKKNRKKYRVKRLQRKRWCPNVSDVNYKNNRTFGTKLVIRKNVRAFRVEFVNINTSTLILTAIMYGNIRIYVI